VRDATLRCPPLDADPTGVRVTQEFAARLPLARNEHDRDNEFRELDDAVEQLLADPDTRFIAVRGSGMLRNADGTLRFVPGASVPADALVLYLGRALADAPDAPAGTRFAAALLDPESHAAAVDAIEPDESRWENLRMFGTELSARDQGLAVEAVAMANWHAVHGFSPRTGSTTTVEKAGGCVATPPATSSSRARTRRSSSA
jgi:NAD+ diphosphatase